MCSDVILGYDFQRLHKQVTFVYGGNRDELIVQPKRTACAVVASHLEAPLLFSNLRPEITPVATKSRYFNSEDRAFIQEEINKLLSDGVIEPSVSPWRAQIVIARSPKRRMCVDYSQTINLYTETDAYPLPHISEIVNQLAQYKYFSSSI